jgi:CheY-like chemotaxis protein
MSVSVVPALDGHRILIVESDIQFQRQLQEALKLEGADTLAVTDPNSVAGAQQITRSAFSVALINDWHRRAHLALGRMPVVVYGGRAPVPAQVVVIVSGLKGLLGMAADGS